MNERQYFFFIFFLQPPVKLAARRCIRNVQTEFHLVIKMGNPCTKQQQQKTTFLDLSNGEVNKAAA